MTRKEPHVKVVPVRPTERHIPLREKKCAHCRQRFLGMTRQQYCSKRCSNLAAYRRNPEAYRQSRLKSYRRQKEQEGKE